MSLARFVTVGSGHRPLSDAVFDAVLARLLDGDLAPESSLKIEALARDMEVSATPVREALARLEATGLVVRTARRGYMVARQPTTKELADLMDARLVIEPVSTLLACVNGGSALLDALEESARELTVAPRGTRYHDYRAYFEADERFHVLIAEHSGNMALLAAHRALGGLAQRFRHLHGVSDADAEATVTEHGAIVSAFRLQNPELARDEMARHIASAKARSVGARG